MQEPTPMPRGFIRLTVHCEEGSYPLLLDVSSTLYDFNLIYEFAYLASEGRYDYIVPGPWISTRRGRPMADAARLKLQRLRHESPLEFVTVAEITPAAVHAVAALLVALTTVATAPFVIRYYQLQNRDRWIEIERKLRDDPETRARLQERGLWNRVVAAARRLARSNAVVRIREIVIDFLDRL